MRSHLSIGILSLMLAGGAFLIVRLVLPDADVRADATEPPVVSSPERGLVVPSLESRGSLEDAENDRGAMEEPDANDAPGAATVQAPEASLEEREEHFKWLRATTSVDELRSEMVSLFEIRTKMTADDFAGRFEAKEYVRLKSSSDGGLKLSDLNTDFVQQTRQGEDGYYLLATLPEDQFPEAYEVNRKLNWLEDLVRDKEKQSKGNAGSK